MHNRRTNNFEQHAENCPSLCLGPKLLEVYEVCVGGDVGMKKELKPEDAVRNDVMGGID